MKCHNCNKAMKRRTDLKFNKHTVKGWKCSCGEEYFDSEDAQRILLLNKLKNKGFELKLNRVKSNLILRIPKEVGKAMGLNEKDIVHFSMKNDKEIVIKT